MKTNEFIRRAVLTLLAMLTATTGWAEIIGDASGTCGNNLTWTLTENEDDAVTWANGTSHAALTLTISGTGAMADYAYQGAPWNSDTQSVTRLVLPEGLTTVGDYAFDSFFNVKSVTLPAAVTSIGQRGFYGGGNKTSSGCTFTAADGSQLSSIGTEAFHNYYGNVDLRNCTSLTSIGTDVFKRYRKNTLYLPVSMRTIAANAIYYQTNYSSDKPKVRVAYDNSVVSVNGTYKGSGTGTVLITTSFNIQKKSSDAVSISQIFFDDIALTWNGDGHYFEIADEQDLIDLAEYIRGGSDRGCEGATFKMTADLDFSAMPLDCHDKNGNGTGNFLPIGIVSDTKFAGHFDGDGHTITGLQFSYPHNGVGLFSNINSTNATVENVTLVNPAFSAYGDIGGIAGTLQAGTISNCHVVGGSLTIDYETVGGIVGFSNYNNSTNVKSISGCSVIGTTLSGSEGVGAIVGWNNDLNAATAALTISNCTYDAATNENIVGYGDGNRYTDGGGNVMVYQINLGDGITSDALTVGSYTVAPEGQTVTLGHDSRTGYDFGGYESSDATISDGAFTMPAKVVTVSILWTVITYTISYDLAGGSVATENPATYTIESEAITLVNPTRDGYTFAGWTGTDLTDVTETVTITTGSTGNRTYIATWTKNELVLSETDGMSKLISDWQGKQVDVSFSRTFSANVASTICLPFAISADQAAAVGKFYSFAGVITTGTEWVVTMQETNAANDALTANTPYLFMPSVSREVTFSGTIANVADTYTAGTTDSGDWTYQGTYKTIEWTTDPRNIYGFASGQAYGNSGDETEAGKFIRVHTGGIRPFRAYLQYSGSGQARALSRSATDGLPETMTVRLIGANGQTTAIGTLDTRTGEATFGTDAWYTLDGRRLSGQPTAKGIYIYKGKKVIIK